MDRKKASDFPQELLNLFDGYVHGRIDRRAFLDGAQKFAVGRLTAAALFEMLRPNYAWATQVPENDARIKAENATVPSPQGNGSVSGYLVRQANAQGNSRSFWSCTKIAGSTRTSRTSRGAWRSRSAWPLRPTV
jgi:carboxymethylenebutenolidase